MEQFYNIVIGVAIAVLIFCLVIVGIMLQKGSDGKPFPNYATQCPDGWQITQNAEGETTCVVPMKSSQNFPQYPTELDNDRYKSDGSDKVISNISSGTTITEDSELKFNIIASKCDLRKWSNTVGVSWDGITNYNQCD